MIVPRSELRVFRQLETLVAGHGCSLHLSTRLSDVVDCRTGVPNGYFDWATRAHVDLLIRDNSRGMAPVVAIEVDGPHHHSDHVQMRRDRIKDDALAAAGVDCIRVSVDSINTSNGRDCLAAYLAKLWFAGRAFDAAQQGGIIGPYEVFLPSFTFTPNDDTGALECLDPTMSTRAMFARAHELTGTPAVPYPQVWYWTEERTARVFAKAMLPVTRDRWLGCEVTISGFSVPGVPPDEVAEELAIYRLGELFEAWRRGTEAARPLTHLRGWLPQCPPMATWLADPTEWRSNIEGGPMEAWLAQAKRAS